EPGTPGNRCRTPQTSSPSSPSRVSSWCLGTPPRFHLQNDLAVLVVNMGGTRPEKEPDAFIFQDLLQFQGNVCIFPGQDVVVTMHDRHVIAEPAKHLPELQADVPAPNDQQVSGQFAQLEDAGVRQVINPIQARERRDGWPGAGVDEDALALEL